MKSIELKLISELMKNSRRSDRELAKAVGVSQPTVSRTIKRLEKEGYIKEYTIIPDFQKLGFHLLALTFVRLRQGLSKETSEKARVVAKESLANRHYEIIMLERGLGLNYTGVIVSYHEDYASYLELRKWLLQFDFLEIKEVQSFMISLDDEVHYRPLTFSSLAHYIEKAEKKEDQAV